MFDKSVMQILEVYLFSASRFPVVNLLVGEMERTRNREKYRWKEGFYEDFTQGCKREKSIVIKAENFKNAFLRFISSYSAHLYWLFKIHLMQRRLLAKRIIYFTYQSVTFAYWQLEKHIIQVSFPVKNVYIHRNAMQCKWEQFANEVDADVPMALFSVEHSVSKYVQKDSHLIDLDCVDQVTLEINLSVY